MSNSNELNHSGIMVGTPVTGHDFFNRDNELREFEDLIQQGAHVLVTAPRRIGKTSLLLEAGRRIGAQFVFLFVDVQSCTTEVDGVVKLALKAKEHRDIGHRVLDGFRNVIAALGTTIQEISVADLTLKLREGLSADWRTKSDEILDRLAHGERAVVVCFDELPVLVSALLCGEDRRMMPERVERTRVFLSWLREATIRHQGKIRFVVSGSIGLEPLLTRAGISETMTTFTPLELRPWSSEVALAYIENRSRRLGLAMSEGAGRRMLELIGELIPHHVAMFMHFVRFDCQRRSTAGCTLADVGRVYRQHMLSVHGHVDLATYEDRLKRVVGPEMLRAALELLTEAAVADRLTPDAAKVIANSAGFSGQEAADTLRFLLAVFEHDGYLRRSGVDYVFVSRLLRDWWRNRFSFGYVPAKER